MDARQEEFSNPFSMDETCTNCDALCQVRERVVHGYGDVSAEFLFVGEAPSESAEAAGVPLVGGEVGSRLQEILGDLGFSRSSPAATEPELRNAYLTLLTRCRHPDRDPTDSEVRTCEPFLNAEIRMINPELLVPIGQRALEALAIDYTTYTPEELDVETRHATTVRGRGFELLPMIDPVDQSDAEREAFLKHVRENVFSRDYRQTKGRRGR